MKRLALVLICFAVCATTVIAADKKVETPEQALVIKVEQLKGTIEYADDHMKALEIQYRNFATVKEQAQRELAVAEGRLKAGKKK